MAREADRDNVTYHTLFRSINAAIELERLNPSLTQSACSRTPLHHSHTTRCEDFFHRSIACHRCHIRRQLLSLSDGCDDELSRESKELLLAATELVDPFATLSPNLSQLAFTVERQSHNSLQSNSNNSSSSHPRHWHELIDGDGMLIWASFTIERMQTPSAASSPSTISPSSTNLYSTTSAFIASACQVVHTYVMSMTPDVFYRRYSHLFDMSQHGEMIQQLFQLYYNGCHRIDTYSSTSPTGSSSSPSSDTFLSSSVIFMILSTHIERLIGDIFCARRSSPSVLCPRMLRDLFLSPQVAEFLPPQCMHLLQSLCGSPKSFNTRNILWHGFINLACQSTHDALESFTSMLWMVWIGLLKECETLWREKADLVTIQPNLAVSGQSVNPDSTHANIIFTILPAHTQKAPFRRPLKYQFYGDGALYLHLTSSIFAKPALSSHMSEIFNYWPFPPSSVFDSSDADWNCVVNQFNSLLSSSYIFPHHRVHDIVVAFRWIRFNPFIALTMLLPCLEQVMRQAFVYFNANIYSSNMSTHTASSSQPTSYPHPDIEVGLMFAQTERLFTTLDIVLGDVISPISQQIDSDLDESIKPTPPSKCSRTSAFAFPLVPTCTFDHTAYSLNQLYHPSHPSIPHVPSIGVMYALVDVAINRLGPRIRDRVAHGEIRWNHPETLPPWLVLWAFNIMAGLAVQFPLHQPALCGTTPAHSSTCHTPAAIHLIMHSPVGDRARACFDSYLPAFHCRSQFMRRMTDAKFEIDRMQHTLNIHTLAVTDDNMATKTEADDAPLVVTSSASRWYVFGHSYPVSLVSSHLPGLISAGSHQLQVMGNAIALQSAILIRQMREQYPTMPMWNHMTEWIERDSTKPSSNQQCPNRLEWWTFGANDFFNHPHRDYHHPHSPSSSHTCCDISDLCSLSCQLRCFDSCMSGAPALAIQRLLDAIIALPNVLTDAYNSLKQKVAQSELEVNSKTNSLSITLLIVDSLLPSLTITFHITLVTLIILFKQLYSKAHSNPIPDMQSTSSDTNAELISQSPQPAPSPSHSPPSSSPSSSPSPSPSPSLLLLREDRSIARILKKLSGSLDRIKSAFSNQRWNLALAEAAQIGIDIQQWYNHTHANTVTSM